MSRDLSSLYSLRNTFTVIALTGRTGSGCTTIANQIEKGFIEDEYPTWQDFDLNINAFKKYKIIYKYAKENFEPFKVIAYRDIITLFLLKDNLETLINYTNSEDVKTHFDSNNLISLTNFENEIIQLKELREDFNSYRKVLGSIDFKIKGDKYFREISEIYFSEAFKGFSKKLHNCFSPKHATKHYLFIQLITNNIRKSGLPYSAEATKEPNIFCIAEMINFIIKANGKKGEGSRIVIDSLRNPFEVMFFKQRFSAFYLIAVNRDDKSRERKLIQKYSSEEYDWIKDLIELEYKGSKDSGFFTQYVRECIEKADIHITYENHAEIEELNKSIDDNSSPHFSWKMQLLKYISLMSHPGLITPSPEERSMQLAYTAKYNSGCISRQVGAAVTDENYSVKAIGWNNTPEGQVPCLLRDAEPLINATEEELYFESTKPIKEQNPELKAFTPFEKTDIKFKSALKEHYKTSNNPNLKGRSVCFCFKSLHNSCYDGKNQVHTRSLHAEESAFLQIAKYGGVAIKNGKLFTTASPCELCSKKAYQLGIKVIYYIDPYPGISKEQILETGTRQPSIRLFNGAIGNAYHWLYEPLMAYKDELALILGHDIKDLTSKYKIDNDRLRKENDLLKKELNGKNSKD